MKYQVCEPLTEHEYADLKASIAKHGILVPIEIDEQGSILDGHHRVRAWQELRAGGVGVSDYARLIRVGLDEEAKFDHALRLNDIRRHMSKEARERTRQRVLEQREQIRQQVLEQRKEGKTLQEIADEVGVGKSTVQRDLENSTFPPPSDGKVAVGKDGKARPQKYKPRKPKRSGGLFTADAKSQDSTLGILNNLKEKAPDLLDSVIAGEMKPTAAQREANKREKHTPKTMPDGIYRVWYADPPWSYGNSGVITDSDAYGRAERHYPTMSIEELSAMGPDIVARCPEEAVLFMWVTSPLLEECFPVIRAWGFQYKTSFVWDKIGHNYGHYNSVRHELLLVCTRGSCTPDAKTLHDSVLSIEKSDKHSEKPEEFRRIIDELYTWGKRIELFARTSTIGWDNWGNEA